MFQTCMFLSYPTNGTDRMTSCGKYESYTAICYFFLSFFANVYYEIFIKMEKYCCEMAAVPQGAFAVRKIREMNEREFLQMDFHIKNGNEKTYRRGSFKKNLTEEREPTPLKYNSKLMNSIWGEYNRYSVHNFKKNTAADEGGIISAAWGSILKPISTSPAATTTNIVVDMKHHV
ncbi:hypothetical protein PV327_005452 [Microctonus hyperodae]|uniref:Uncharacterized protein n=1 Tax=Microctonus hyperodae TaxID=165561 RepID=A0AA39G1D7_MICHY|nr:hypothetical protein PV327_005452 [Microctonus hyperodae]